MGATLDQLTTLVAQTESVDQAALAVIQAQTAQISDLKAQIVSLTAAQEDQATLQALLDRLKASNDALAAGT